MGSKITIKQNVNPRLYIDCPKLQSGDSQLSPSTRKRKLQLLGNVSTGKSARLEEEENVNPSNTNIMILVEEEADSQVDSGKLQENVEFDAIYRQESLDFEKEEDTCFLKDASTQTLQTITFTPKTVNMATQYCYRPKTCEKASHCNIRTKYRSIAVST